MNESVIIVAGGIGKRMGSETPKQFLCLAGKPILMRTIECFAKYNENIDIVVTLPESQMQTWQQLCAQYDFKIKHTTVCGGITRFHSVRNALAKVNATSEVIAVHDGVRPLVSLDTIKKCFSTAAEKGTAVPTIEITESLRRIKDNESEIVNREGMCLIQTPQTFDAQILKTAYQQSYTPDITDDASVVERAGYKINFVIGNRENIKITMPYDLQFAEKLI